ncbi:hypothetical protein [Sphingobium bisphenolivorans]|uniref:hypothetical protein n=1 Tax=Sphingobium bisphenolivorans TaxID=1335760 RepID=UPI00187C4506|nr:hypothetical protein [Sphingobium bisphenolivorans]
MRRGPAVGIVVAAWAAAAGAAPVEEPILWKGPAMPEWRDADRLILSGVLEDGHFKPSALAPELPTAAPGPALIPLAGNLLPLADIRPFGVEERIAVERTGEGITLRCRPGKAPAGVVLSWPGRRFPLIYRGEWRVDGASRQPLPMSVVLSGTDGKHRPEVMLGQGVMRLPYEPLAAPSLVIACPPEAASGRLHSVMIEPLKSDAIHSRGTWVWSDAAWRTDPAAFARRAADAGWNELAIQLPAEPDAAVQALIAALAERGIRFRFVEGAPAYATPGGLDHALPQFARWRRWCEANLVRLPMLELDIEPYTLASSGADPGGGWAGWVTAIHAISAAWGQPVAVDVPWWMTKDPGGREALSRAEGAIAEIVIMAYRTDPQLILDAVEPWFAAYARPIRIAIESGPVATEVTRTYQRAGRGTLRLGATGTVLLTNAREAGEGEVMFAMAGEQVTSPARVSFHGSPDRAAAVERAIAPLLQGWPRFAGFRVHGWMPEGETK